MFVHPYTAALLATAKQDDYLEEARRAALAHDVALREAPRAAAPRNDAAPTSAHASASMQAPERAC